MRAAAKLKMEITSKPLHLDEIDRKVMTSPTQAEFCASYCSAPWVALSRCKGVVVRRQFVPLALHVCVLSWILFGLPQSLTQTATGLYGPCLLAVPA